MPTVLIVDDDQSLRLLCRVNLELEGYGVIEARDAAEAEEALAGGDVDLSCSTSTSGPTTASP